MTAAPTPTGAIRARNFSYWYGTRPALHALSLDVAPRAVTAIIGPSGSGKSTFLRAINRMNELVPGARHEGELTLDGDDVHAPEQDVVALRQRVGMVFQQWNPFPRSVRDNVSYGPRLSSRLSAGEESALVEEALRRAALWDEVKDRLDQSALALSGGQQQRLCIARALANRPEVLLLDEPTSALDPVATRKIEELLYALKRDLTIILVTHNLQQAARTADVTAFLDAGRLVEMDASSRLFTRPADPRTEAYITGRFG